MRATEKEALTLAELAIQMWNSHTVDELETEFTKTLNDEHSAFFIKCITIYL